jgi:hypothetical protein
LDGHLRVNPVGGRPSLPKQRADGAIEHKMLWAAKRPSTTRGVTRLRFVITMRRLDAPAPHVKRSSRGAGRTREALIWPTIVTFPSTGCWKVEASWNNGPKVGGVMLVELK